MTRVWNADISPSDMIPQKSVEEWYHSVKETLSEEVGSWLGSVFCAAKEKKLTTGGTVLLTIIDSEFGPASDALVQTVQDTMDPDINAGDGYGLAPIGHVVKVESAKVKQVAIKSTITFEPGYGWDNLQSSIEDAVSDYFLGLRKEWSDTSYLVVRVSQVDNRILGVPGVIDVQDTFLNGAASNLVLDEYEIPMFGGVSG